MTEYKMDVVLSLSIIIRDYVELPYTGIAFQMDAVNFRSNKTRSSIVTADIFT